MNEFDDLKSRWKDLKKTPSAQRLTVNQIINLAKKKKDKNTTFYYWNIGILSITLISIYLFFERVVNLQSSLSQMGIFLMEGGLLLRILIEVLSLYKSSKIDLTSSAKETIHRSEAFLRFRKNIHGPVTIIIMLLYSLGVFSLNPEFSVFFTTLQLLAINGFYVIWCGFFIWNIRKKIKSEINNLKIIIELKKQMSHHTT